MPSTVICLEDDSEEVTVVSAREPRCTRIEGEPSNNSGITSNEPAAKKIKLDAHSLTSLGMASVATISTTRIPEPSRRSNNAKERARIQLELEQLKIQREEGKLKMRLLELDDEH
ncbi:hypothetical protein LTR22_027981 [Elasticomyces elasticus]|nr:hypothetical protein LTR22_027981 [Elasticomyces elasticus]